MKIEVEITERDITNLKLIRNYFGVNDKTSHEHLLYEIAQDFIKKLSIHSVSNSADVNEDKGQGICKEKGCDKFAVIDYNGHGHWNCQSCYDRNERYFEANYD